MERVRILLSPVVGISLGAVVTYVLEHKAGADHGLSTYFGIWAGVISSAGIALTGGS